MNRITKARILVEDLFGKLMPVWKIIRTSNSYIFRDPLPCASKGLASKSENPSGTLNQDLLSSAPPPKIIILDPENQLDAALKNANLPGSVRTFMVSSLSGRIVRVSVNERTPDTIALPRLPLISTPGSQRP